MFVNKVKIPYLKPNGEVDLDLCTTVTKKNTMALLKALPKANWYVNKPKMEIIQRYLKYIDEANNYHYDNDIDWIFISSFYEKHTKYKGDPKYARLMSDEAVAVATIFAISGYQIVSVRKLEDQFLTFLANNSVDDLDGYLYGCAYGRWPRDSIIVQYVGYLQEEPAKENIILSDPALDEELITDMPESLREHLKKCTSVDSIVREVCRIQMLGPKYRRADDSLDALLNAWNTVNKE